MKNIFKNPFAKIVLMYLGFILIGSLLLKMNIFINSGEKVSWVEAFFTSVSAFTTTGLSLFNYSEVYNDVGQILLILFFNIGGMGIMTINTIVFIFIGKKIGVHNRILAKIDLNRENTDGLVKIVKTIIVTFLSIEAVGTILIFFRTKYLGLPFIDRLINSMFMASSAVTGSGFYDTVPYRGDFVILTILIVLMVFSFIGYPVVLDIIEFIKHKASGNPRKYKFSTFTKISLVMNSITLVIFAVIFLGLEWNNILINNNFIEKIYYSLYISTSTKSVGLSVFPDINNLMPLTLLFSTIFMIIGGAPSSACGGIRVTTVYVIFINIRAQFMHKKESVYGRYYVSDKTVLKAYYVTFMFVLTSFLGYIVIIIFNTNVNYIQLWYDVISAITTTGFSTGALNTLNDFGIIIIALLMFIGRIGIINLSGSIIHKKNKQRRIKYLEKDIII